MLGPSYPKISGVLVFYLNNTLKQFYCQAEKEKKSSRPEGFEDLNVDIVHRGVSHIGDQHRGEEYALASRGSCPLPLSSYGHHETPTVSRADSA